MSIGKVVRAKDLSIFEFAPGSNYRNLVSRKTAVLFRVLHPLGVCEKQNYKKLLGYSHSYAPIYLERRIYYNVNELAQERKILLQRYAKDKRIFYKLAKKCHNEGDKLMKFSEEATLLSLRKVKTEKLISLFKKFIQMHLAFQAFLCLPVTIQPFLEKSVDEQLKKSKLSASKREKYHKILCTPKEKLRMLPMIFQIPWIFLRG